jgi:hypothetical protein
VAVLAAMTLASCGEIQFTSVPAVKPTHPITIPASVFPDTIPASSVARHEDFGLDVWHVGPNDPAQPVLGDAPEFDACNTFAQEGLERVGYGYIMDSPALVVASQGYIERAGVIPIALRIGNSDQVTHTVFLFTVCLKTNSVVHLRRFPVVSTPTSGMTIPAGTSGTVSWHCPGVPQLEEYDVFRGDDYGVEGEANAIPGTFQIETSKPLSDGWQMTVHALSSDVTVSSYGECDTGRLVAPCTYSRSVTLSPGATGTVSVGCPPGTVLLNGGFEVPEGHGVVVTESAPGTLADLSPAPVTLWHVTAVDLDQVPHLLLADALCAQVAAAELPVPTSTPTPA